MELDAALVEMTKSALALNEELREIALREGDSPTTMARMMVLDNRADYLCRRAAAALCAAIS